MRAVSCQCICEKRLICGGKWCKLGNFATVKIWCTQKLRGPFDVEGNLKLLWGFIEIVWSIFNFYEMRKWQICFIVVIPLIYFLKFHTFLHTNSTPKLCYNHFLLQFTIRAISPRVAIWIFNKTYGYTSKANCINKSTLCTYYVQYIIIWQFPQWSVLNSLGCTIPTVHNSSNLHVENFQPKS